MLAAIQLHGVAVGKIQFAIKRAVFGHRAVAGNAGHTVAVELPVAMRVHIELRADAARLVAVNVLETVKVVAHDGRLPIRADKNVKDPGVRVVVVDVIYLAAIDSGIRIKHLSQLGLRLIRGPIGHNAAEGVIRQGVIHIRVAIELRYQAPQRVGSGKIGAEVGGGGNRVRIVRTYLRRGVERQEEIRQVGAESRLFGKIVRFKVEQSHRAGRAGVPDEIRRLLIKHNGIREDSFRGRQVGGIRQVEQARIIGQHFLNGQSIRFIKVLQMAEHEVEVVRSQGVAREFRHALKRLHQQEIAVIHRDAFNRGFILGEGQRKVWISYLRKVCPRRREGHHDVRAVKRNRLGGVVGREHRVAVDVVGEGGRPVVDVPSAGGKLEAVQEIAACRLLGQNQYPGDGNQCVGRFIGRRQGHGRVKIGISTGQIVRDQARPPGRHQAVGGLRRQTRRQELPR